MADVLTRLEAINNKLEQLGLDMAREERLYKAEREERDKLGLTGEAAYQHFIEFMGKHGITIND